MHASWELTSEIRPHLHSRPTNMPRIVPLGMNAIARGIVVPMTTETPVPTLAPLIGCVVTTRVSETLRPESYIMHATIAMYVVWV